MSFISRLFGRSKTILHYTGHRILSDPKVSRFPAKREAYIAKLLSRLIKKEHVRAGYGGLASGSDILFAEALLAAEADLHIVLACDTERFMASSVAEAGPKWVARFRAALSQATTVTFVAGDEATEIDYAAATHLALDLGEAAGKKIRAARLQIAVFDGRPSSGAAGTGPDMERAAQRGWRQIVLNPVARGRIKPEHL